MSWINSAKDIPLDVVATMLELEPGRPASGRPTFSCPSCGAATRHTKSKDRRGAVGLTVDLQAWRCHQCDAHGDAIDLVAYAIGNARLGSLVPDQKARVREWFSSRGAVETRPIRRRKPVEPPPVYPPAEEVEALWMAARPVTGDAEVTGYLDGRCIPSTSVELHDLARSLPAGVALPPWARGPHGDWLSTGHRLMVPMFDAAGKMQSLIARAITTSTPKSLAPAGFSRRGLVLADSLARHVVKSGLPSWWDAGVSLTLVLAEGEPDWLTISTCRAALSDSGHGLSCIGLLNGALPADLVPRIPTGTKVIIAEQTDEKRNDGQPTAAEQYTARILKTLQPRADAGEIKVKVKV